jgi:branched-chain amino acid aminotransferase
VILTDPDDNVVEGPGFNVFAVKGGRVFTPESGVLEGITRKTVIELPAEKDIPLEARAVPADEVRGADEVFLTSTAGGIMPVTKVDGKPGPITLQLREAYWALHDDTRFATPDRY